MKNRFHSLIVSLVVVAADGVMIVGITVRRHHHTCHFGFHNFDLNNHRVVYCWRGFTPGCLMSIDIQCILSRLVFGKCIYVFTYHKYCGSHINNDYLDRNTTKCKYFASSTENVVDVEKLSLKLSLFWTGSDVSDHFILFYFYLEIF